MTPALKNILCIDDDEDILGIAKFALENLGHFQLEMCCGGKEAIARAPSFRPDMILLDVVMPGMDGVSVYRELRKMPKFANTPIAFMTAKVQPSEVIDYLEMGVEGIIPKPFDPMELSGAVQSLWNTCHEKTRKTAHETVAG